MNGTIEFLDNELIKKNIELTQEVMRLQNELNKREEQLIKKGNELETLRKIVRNYWRRNNERYEQHIAKRNKSIIKSIRFKDVVYCIVIPIVFIVSVTYIILSL